MSFLRYNLIASLVGLGWPSLPALASEQQCETALCEVSQVAFDWTRAWNEEDLDYILEIHQPDVVYIWRGRPLSYEFFEDILPSVFEGEDNEMVVESSPLVLGSADNQKWLYFRMGEMDPEGKLVPLLAISMLLVREEEDWKILTIHESGVRTGS